MELDAETEYPVHTNLLGAYNCLELARRDEAQFVFLSTSRVYPFEALDAIAYEEGPTRFELGPEQELAGVSAAGIAEDFPLHGARTLYGATKLAAELLIAEYAARFGLRTVVDRCGVIAGPWQMGRVDQGVFAFWVLHHHFGVPLSYIGYGGSGRQVRDLLHVEDLIELIDAQLLDPDHWAGRHGKRRRRPRVQPLAARDDRDLPRVDRQRGADRARREDALRRRADLPLRLPAAVRAHRRGGRRRGAERVLADIFDWVSENSAMVGGALGIPAPR